MVMLNNQRVILFGESWLVGQVGLASTAKNWG